MDAMAERDVSEERSASAQQESLSTPSASHVSLGSAVSNDEQNTRTARVEAKYRVARPPPTIGRLPRGFVWADPDEQLERPRVEKQEVPGVGRWGTVRVPEHMVYLVERAGVFHRVLYPGFRIVVPGVDKIKYAFSQRMQKITFATSHVPTADNVHLYVKATLHYVVCFCNRDVDRLHGYLFAQLREQHPKY